MKYRYIVCHYDEIALKGDNRKMYERVLIRNISKKLTISLPESTFAVKRRSGRILIYFNQDIQDIKKAENALKTIFGIAHFAFVVSVPQTMEAIKEASLLFLKNAQVSTFRVTAKRSQKNFPLTSPEIQREVGEFLLDNTDTTVDLHHPEFTCNVNVVDNEVLIYGQKIDGSRGLPTSTSGHALCSFSGGIDSPVAAYYMMKRGMTLSAIHFHVYPFTSQASIEKVRSLVSVLTAYQPKINLHLVAFADIQTEIVSSCPAKLRIILYRRMMLRIAEAVAKQAKMKALITGEALSQVSSQTIENITATNEAVDILIMRPLIGFDKIEIVKKAQEIGTYDISILPHEDACTRFTPEHPETHAKLHEVQEAEKALDIQKLIEQAISKTNTEVITYDKKQQ